MLAGPNLWKKMLLRYSITVMFTCPLLSSFTILISFMKNNVVVFPFPFHIFMPLINLCLFRLQAEFPILRTRSFPEYYTLIRLPRRLLALDRWRTLIPGLIRSPPMLAVYWVAHSLLLGGVVMNYLFT